MQLKNSKLNFIAYCYLGFCQTDFDELFEAVINKFNSCKTDHYRPDKKIKKLFHFEDCSFDIDSLCDTIDCNIKSSSYKTALKLYAAKLISDIFMADLNTKRTDLKPWEQFTLVKLTDFLNLLEMIYEDFTLKERLMGEIKDYVNEAYGFTGAAKYFDFNNMTIGFVIKLIISEAESQYFEAENRYCFSHSPQIRADLKAKKRILHKGYELVKKLIIDGMYFDFNHHNTLAYLIEQIELNKL